MTDDVPMSDGAPLPRDDGPPMPPRPPRSLFVHWAIDTLVVFVGVLFLAIIANLPINVVLVVAAVLGLVAAPFTRRAEVRALEERAKAWHAWRGGSDSDHGGDGDGSDAPRDGAQ